MVRLVLLAFFACVPPAAAQQNVTFPVTSERPAEVVARMARQAMGLPADPERWRALADALPEMALLGNADLESTFEAARIADSLSASAAVRATQEATWDDTLLMVSGVVQEYWISFAVALLATALAGAGVARLKRGRTREHTSARRGGRVEAARSLAIEGLSVHEIARRTGMAQDAVHVLLGMTDNGLTPSRSLRSQFERPATGTATIAVDLQRETLLAANRLRDQRLTYGPGARA